MGKGWLGKMRSRFRREEPPRTHVLRSPEPAPAIVLPETDYSSIWSADFRRGYEEAKAGKPLEAPVAADKDETWAQIRYEAGRLFAQVYDGPLDCPAALDAHMRARSSSVFSYGHEWNCY